MGTDIKYTNKTPTLKSRAPKEASSNFWGAASPTGRLVHFERLTLQRRLALFTPGQVVSDRHGCETFKIAGMG